MAKTNLSALPGFTEGVIPTTPRKNKIIASYQKNEDEGSSLADAYPDEVGHEMISAGNSPGFLNRAGEADGKATHYSILVPRAKLWMFWQMDLTIEAAGKILKGARISDSGRVSVLKKMKKWRDDWMREMWASKFFIDFVRENVHAFNIANIDTTAFDQYAYDMLTANQAKSFWTHPSRFDKDVMMEIFGVLNRAVYLNKVWTDPEWNAYVSTVFAIARHATWNLRIKLVEDGKEGTDWSGVFTVIREAVRGGRSLAKRPPIEQVPTRSSIHQKPTKPMGTVLAKHDSPETV